MMIQFTFTNNNAFGVVLSSVDPSSAREIRQDDVAPRTFSSCALDMPIGTVWRVKTSDTGILFDAYQTTSAAMQSHVIRDCQTALEFINRTNATAFLFSVHPVSKQEHPEGSIPPGGGSTKVVQPMGVLFPNTEWRMKDAAGATIDTYFTTTAHDQHVDITVRMIPVMTPGSTLYQGPLPTNPSSTPSSTPTPPPPLGVGRGQDSILNSRSFNLDVALFERSIRERAGLTDINQIRAAVYAALMAVAQTSHPTPKEQALMDWLALQVKATRIDAARFALMEYDRWNYDPWSYQPPGGYDFPPYRLLPARSFVWLSSTPNPPVLATESWQSFLADILASGGWSPLNNPIFTKGRRTTSLEGVVGFPVFGAVLAYQKLYSTDEGARIFAHATAQLSTRFPLAPLTPGAAVDWSKLATLRTLFMEEIAPYVYREGMQIVTALYHQAGGAFEEPLTEISLSTMPAGQLQAVLKRLTSADLLSSLVCTVVLTLAIQALIGEVFALDTKTRLRGQLVDELTKQQSAQLPDVGELLYYDIRGQVAAVTPDYQPTNPTELERLMGSQEVYRAFLLATIG